MKKLFTQKRFWFAVLILFTTIFIVARFFCMNGCLSLEHIRQHREYIKDFIDDYYWLSMLLFFLIYVFENVFSLPIAAAMAVGAGYFYGTAPAILLTLISATCGAWASFYLARFLLGNFLQTTYHLQLARFNREFKRHGAYYLLVIRLLPFVPFVLVNMFAGLTLVPFSTFTWTTVIGMTPLITMYVVAGHQLQTIASLHDIFSWQMAAILGILIMLTIMPLLLKKMGVSLRGLLR